jgi:hypothetical protein
MIKKVISYFARRTRHKKRMSEQRDSSIVIVSFPKCGRTWLRILVGRYMQKVYLLPNIDILDTYSLSKDSKVNVTLFTHDDLNMNKPFHFSRLHVDLERYKDKTVIFLLREPKDVMVSWYFQISKRRGVNVGSISEFVRNDGYGIRKYVAFVNNWFQAKAGLSCFHVITYEQMHKDCGTTLSAVISLITNGEPLTEAITEAIEYGSFTNLKKLEGSGAFESKVMKAKDTKDPNSFKVRSGKIAGYQEHLSPEDISFIDSVVEMEGCLLFSQYYV